MKSVKFVLKTKRFGLGSYSVGGLSHAIRSTVCTQGKRAHDVLIKQVGKLTVLPAHLKQQQGFLAYQNYR